MHAEPGVAREGALGCEWQDKTCAGICGATLGDDDEPSEAMREAVEGLQHVFPHLGLDARDAALIRCHPYTGCAKGIAKSLKRLT